MAKKSKSKTPEVMELPVHYGNVNVGELTCRIGITMARSLMTPERAIKTLCGKRLNGRILARPAGAGATQPALPDMDGDVDLEGTFDVKSVGFNPKEITCGLTFSLEDVDSEALIHFAQRDGILSIDSFEPIPAKKNGRKKATAEATANGDGDGAEETE